MIRITELALPFDHGEDAVKKAVERLLKVGPGAVREMFIVKKSLDARRKARIQAIYTVDVEVEGEETLLEKLAGNKSVRRAEVMRYTMPLLSGGAAGKERPIVVGSGPCGLFAALMLAELGLRPIVLERGKDVKRRIQDTKRFWELGVLDAESNVQFGEGGAGTFSDGKLTTQIKDKLHRSRKVLEALVQAGAPEEILYQAKPHIGTDNLIRVVQAIRQRIIELGGEVRFEAKVTGLTVRDGHVAGVVVNGEETMGADVVVLALGHSARDTFEMLDGLGVAIAAKSFSIGVRIEHPQKLVNKSQYSPKFASHPALGAAEYKLVHHCGNDRSAYTFCMCPGGIVVASSSEPGGVVTNGMSFYKRNRPNANSALLVGVSPDDYGSENPLAGIEFQRQWEQRAYAVGGSNYYAPVQRVGDFLAGRASQFLGSVQPSYTPGVTPCDLKACLPGFVVETLLEALPALDHKLKGFTMHDAVMTAVESRSSSPIRILRDETFESVSIKGLYPAGEGAGYAGGIVSSAIDGIKVAEAICGRNC